jgi:DNA topoisomerase VI subunit A
MFKMSGNIIELKHEEIKKAKPEADKILKSGKTLQVPRLTIAILRNRWRAYSKHGAMLDLDPEIDEMIKAALEAIITSPIIVDQRDIYYSIRMAHPDWTLAGHEMKTEEAYNTFTGAIMEKLQLATGFTMQSLGVRAGPRGYITGDDRSFFTLLDGRKIPVNANPVIQFNLVDDGVTYTTQARKLIHYEKAAGMNTIITNDLPLMIEATYMTSQGYNVEAATKMHADMEKRGLKLYVLGDADPHGMNIQLMYGRASKSNAYMPDCFYPKNAVLLGLNPRVALALNLPFEHVTDVHMRVVPNLRQLIELTRPEMLEDVEIFEKQRKQWEWQSLNGLDPLGPAVYLIEALYARGDEIKYVPDANSSKETIQEVIKKLVDEFIEDEIAKFARDWLMENLFPKLVNQVRQDLDGEIADFQAKADEELEVLRNMKAEDLREAIKLKLVKNPKQYWTDALRKVIGDILKQRFDIRVPALEGDVQTHESSIVETEIKISDPEVPSKPLEKIDIVESIEKRITTKKTLIQKLRDAIQKVFGCPSEIW